MMIEKNETFFVFQNNGTVPVNYVFSQNIFECTYVRTYVTVRIDEDKITSERI